MGQPLKRPTEREEAIETLRAAFPVGSTVWTVVRHVARSGMSRKISALKIGPDAFEEGRTSVLDYSGAVARALGRKLDHDHLAVVCHGAGMDMTFELVYALGQALHGDGYSLKREMI